MRRSQFKQCFQNLMRKEKPYWNRKQSQKQEPDSYEIDQFQSISSSERTYPLIISHGRMKILYQSIQKYSSVEDTSFLKQRGMLGPYNTSVIPYYYCHCSPLLLLLCPFCPHIVIIVPHRSPLLLLLSPYIIIVVGSNYILTLRLLYM